MKDLKENGDKSNIFLELQVKEKKHSKIDIILFSLTFFCIFICICGYFLSKPEKDVIAYKVPILNTDFKVLFSKNSTNVNQNNFNMPLFNKRQNILILGVDKNPYGDDPFKSTRSDTIILVNIDPKNKSIKAISIPRDSKVFIDAKNGGMQKINAAHALGGIHMAKRTIENTLGVKINRYIIINTEAVIKIVDTLGGIPIYIEKNMSYLDYSDGLKINLKRGEHILNGKEAEGYLRFRKDALGDIGRTSRQQWFLRSFFKKVQDPSVISKIPDLLDIVKDYVKTDMSLYEISNLAAMLKGYSINDIEVATLPGSPSKKGSISYWILDAQQTQNMVDRMIYRKKPKHIETTNLTAGIMYTLNQATKAQEIKGKLEKLGYSVNISPHRHLPHSQFITHHPGINEDFVEKIKNEIPEIKSDQIVYDPIKLYSLDSDFTIIVSDM